MPYVLGAVDVPDRRRRYYAGPERKIVGRMAHRVTDAEDKDGATRFATREAAQAMLEELGGGYEIIEV